MRNWKERHKQGNISRRSKSLVSLVISIIVREYFINVEEYEKLQTKVFDMTEQLEEKTQAEEQEKQINIDGQCILSSNGK